MEAAGTEERSRREAVLLADARAVPVTGQPKSFIHLVQKANAATVVTQYLPRTRLCSGLRLAGGAASRNDFGELHRSGVQIPGVFIEPASKENRGASEENRGGVSTSHGKGFAGT